jgi:hypothetical protein
MKLLALTTGVGVGMGDELEIGVGVGLAGCCVLPELLTLPHPDKTNNVITVQRIRNNSFVLIGPHYFDEFALHRPVGAGRSYCLRCPELKQGRLTK